MPKRKRMIHEFEIIHAIQLGIHEVVVGVSPERKFMCGFCTQVEGLEKYTEVMTSGDYLEIMALFAERIKGQAEVLQVQRRILHIPLDMLGSEQCFPLSDDTDIIGKVVAIKPDSLPYEYQRADCQLILVTGGAGARANSLGRAVFGINVFNRRDAGRWNRLDILGEVRPEHMPQWAKEHLAVIKRERALERGGR